ncbi:hypothetical protein JD969_04165 [Planctomycetota bacterium]|nr:hypothetical protein JD969_04165 [Planctomycetota bacterium]
MVAINPSAWKHTLERAKIRIMLQGDLPKSPCRIDEDSNHINLCAGAIVIHEYLHCYAEENDINDFINEISHSQDSSSLLEAAANRGLPVSVIHDIISLNDGLSPKSRVSGLVEYLDLLTYTPKSSTSKD